MSIKIKVMKEQKKGGLGKADLLLPVGESMVLRADTEEHARGLVVKWKEDGGYDVYYWYDDPNNIVAAELEADGVKIGDAIRKVYLGYHPELDEKKTKKGDRCTRIAKRKYDVWPSAYASGAVVKCRQGKIWKGLKEQGMISEEEEELALKISRALRDEGGAAGMDALIKHTKAKKSEIEDTIEDEEKFVVHTDGDIILKDDSLDEKKQSSEDAGDLRKWFGRKGEKGSKGGWVDCNAPDGDGGYKECAQGDRKKKPYCRPTPSACKTEPKNENYIHITEASLDDGTTIEDMEFWDDVLEEAEYQGRKVTLNKPTRGDVKKFKVFVKDPKTGNVKKVNFGDPNMRIRKSNPKARKSFRARHKCKTPGPKTKARYWSCKKW